MVRVDLVLTQRVRMHDNFVHPVNHLHLTFLTFTGFPFLIAGFGFEGK